MFKTLKTNFNIGLFAMSFIKLIPNVVFTQTIIIGTPQQILRSHTQKNLENAYASVLTLTKSKNQIEDELLQVRSNYWTQVSKFGKADQKTEEQYMDLLAAKDMYIFSIHFQDLISKLLLGDKGKYFNGPGSAIDFVAGGKLDRGIQPLAYNEWQDWIENFSIAFEYELKKSIALKNFDFKEILTTPLQKTFGEYVFYQNKRNFAEFLFENPFSPLKSQDPKIYYEAWLLATKCVGDATEAKNEISSMIAIGGSSHFSKFVNTIRSDKNYTITVLRNQSFGYYSKYIAEWYFSRENPNLYALYVIKRRNGGTWSGAQRILKMRIDQFGELKIKSIIDSIYTKAMSSPMQTKENLNQPILECCGDPLVYIQNQWNWHKILDDCIAQKLSNSALLWDEVFKLSKPSTPENSNKIKKYIIDEIARLPASKKFNTPEERYQHLVKYINEELFLTAVNAQLTIGTQLIQANWIGSNPSDMLSKPKIDLSESLLEGIAYTRRDLQTFAIVSFCHQPPSPDGQPEAFLVRLEKAILKFNELEGKYGKNLLFQAIGKTSKPVIPYYLRKTGGLNKEDMMDFLSLNSTDVDQQNKKAPYVKKYKDLLLKTPKSSNPEKEIFRTDEVWVYIQEYYNFNHTPTIHIIQANPPKEDLTDEYIVFCQEIVAPLVRQYLPKANYVYVKNYKKDYHFSYFHQQVLSEKAYQEEFQKIKRHYESQGEPKSDGHIRDRVEIPFSEGAIDLGMSKIKVCIGRDNDKCSF